MYDIKQSTALTVPFFVHDASGDAVTGLSDGSFTKRISKNGAAFAAMTVTITEMENGWYSIPLSTAHSNTLGLLSITFTNAGAKQVNLQWRVQAKLTDDLNDFDAATDTVANVILVATTTTNTDMRGTDSALLASSAPTNFSDLAITVTTGEVTVGTNNDKTGYSISGTKTTLDALNDIAATDIVTAGAIGTLSGAIINVDLVDTTTTNTDMRGTDSALLASSAPTNFSDLAITVTTGFVTVGTNNDKTGYSISGTITTLDGLNDFDPATEAVANVTLVATTTTNTDMRGTDSALLAASAPTNFSDLSISVTTGLVDITQTAADKIWATSVTEPTSVFTWSGDFGDIMNWMGALNRNKITQTATVQTVRDDTDTSTIATAAVSDDSTTFTRAEFV